MFNVMLLTEPEPYCLALAPVGSDIPPYVEETLDNHNTGEEKADSVADRTQGPPDGLVMVGSLTDIPECVG